jgi:uncharacterized membrane protein
MTVVERNALTVIAGGLLEGGPAPGPVPERAVSVPARHSGYVQAVRVEPLLAYARRHRVHVRLRPRVGEHVVAGTTLVWLWPVEPGGTVPDERVFHAVLDEAVRIGRERTFEQDAAFGIRQLVDMACKAMSPAVNDPYTAVQAVDRLSVLFCALATHPLGPYQAGDPDGASVVVPGRDFADYLATMCGLVRRYGAGEPTVAAALLRLLANCAAVGDPTPVRLAALEEQARIIVEVAGHKLTQPADLALVYAEAESLRATIGARRA